MILKYNILI
uniref:Ycf1 n=1 Tax=Euryale ferox TaxID=4414 RepID=A0A2U3TDH0_EURFE|nr:Ycf1 [Euryale ferox]AUD56613.1 Ycf1 [Euryale ferox]